MFTNMFTQEIWIVACVFANGACENLCGTCKINWFIASAKDSNRSLNELES